MRRCLPRTVGWMLAVALLVSLVGPSVVHAQDVRVFQQKPFLRRHRVELAPVTGLSLNDPMVEHISAGGTLYYHFTESIAGGLSYWKTFGQETALYEKVQTDYSLLPRILKTEALISGQLSWAFVHGKFALLNTWVAHYDTALTVGAGTAQTSADAYRFAFNYGLGQRYFLLDWLTFNWELRHYVFFEDSLFHNIMIAFGVGVFIPFGFDYEHPK